jgi:hypothetical protein
VKIKTGGRVADVKMRIFVVLNKKILQVFGFQNDNHTGRR